MLASNIRMVVQWKILWKWISLGYGGQSIANEIYYVVLLVAIVRKYSSAISFPWSRFFAVSSHRNLSSASLSSGFVRFAFSSASLLTPAANFDRACSCGWGIFHFSFGLVTIFVFKRVLSGGVSCSTSSSLIDDFEPFRVFSEG